MSQYLCGNPKPGELMPKTRAYCKAVVPRGFGSCTVDAQIASENMCRVVAPYSVHMNGVLPCFELIGSGGANKGQ